MRLNYDLFTKYLTMLVDMDFIRIQETRDGEDIIITSNGRQAHSELVAWIRSHFGDCFL